MHAQAVSKTILDPPAFGSLKFQSKFILRLEDNSSDQLYKIRGHRVVWSVRFSANLSNLDVVVMFLSHFIIYNNFESGTQEVCGLTTIYVCIWLWVCDKDIKAVML